MPDTASASGYRALRRGRTSEPGRIYLITTVCAGRAPHFHDAGQAHAAARSLVSPGAWRSSRMLCWVLMPDHLHLLLQLGEHDTLSRLVQRLKSATSRAANQAAGRPGRQLWMPGLHDRALRRDEDVRVAARYLIANPLRAGIVAAVADYPYWDAIWLDGADALP